MPRRQLSDRFVRAVRPDTARRLQFQDALQEGLVLQVEPLTAAQRARQKPPRKTYKLYYARLGRPRWYSLGSAGALTLKQARAEARRQLARMALDPALDVQAERYERGRAGTFAELAERYLEEHAKQRNRSWRQGDKLVRRYLLPSWGRRPAADIRRSDVRAVFRRLTDDGAPVLANQVLAAAGAIFNWAIREELLDLPANPCRGIERNPTRSRSRVLKDSELRALLGELEADGGEGLVFANPRSRPYSTLGDEMRRLCAALNLEPRVTPHDLRRTHGTTITRLGLGREAMNRIQNHLEGGIASVYDRHAYEAENRRVQEAVADFMLAIVEGREPDSNVVTLPRAG
jgi:integrase